MAVKRIVANIDTPNVKDLRAFYVDVFEMDVVMDQDWIATLASGARGPVQLSIASEGGSGTAVPDISIEVDNIEVIYARVTELGHPIEYALTQESWGVRRFYVRDPAGKLLNVMTHLE